MVRQLSVIDNKKVEKIPDNWIFSHERMEELIKVLIFFFLAGTMVTL